MSPNHLPLSVTLKIMILSYGDHLSNPTSVKSCCVLQQGTLTPQKVLVISRKRHRFTESDFGYVALSK